MRSVPLFFALGFAYVVAAGCATTGARPGSLTGHTEVGQASYYAAPYHGRATASGERFDTHKLTAAHRTLPFGTRVRVTNLGNGKSVVVTITDRGPFKHGRVIDVSEKAARELGFVRAGTAHVRVQVLAT
jgi:rare lipoprotein A